jgi:hypothetical protein
MFNTNNELAFPDGIYQWVYSICFIHPIHISLGIYYEMYLCALWGGFMFCTSINYWRKPMVPSLERTVDMVCAFTIIPYHYYLSLYTTNKLLCTGIGTSGILFYILSVYIQHNYIKTAALCHCLLHMCISLSASFIYQDYYEQGISLKWHL